MKLNDTKTQTITFICLLITCFFVFSCKKSEEQKKYDHLCQEVMDHYNTDPNPLKLKAAIFLIDNLKEWYSIEGERYGKYVDTIKKYYLNPYTLHIKLLSIKNGYYGEQIVRDIDVLTPEYLIENIDRAFESWEKVKWKDQVSFDNFCQFILPYRIGHEPLENWRTEIVNDSIFKNTGDTLSLFTDIKKAATWFTKKHTRIKKQFVPKYGDNSAAIPDLQYSILNLLSTGSCNNLTQISAFACRATAIPVAMDFTPHWAHSVSGHEWAALITKTGSIRFLLPIRDSLGSATNPDQRPSKIYRHIFSENSASHVKQRGYCAFLPGFFNNPHLIDVTKVYMKTYDISIPVLNKPDKDNFAYLAVSNRETWSLVGWGKAKKRIAHFENVFEKAICLPVFASESGIKPINFPFSISENGTPHFFKPDHKNLRQVELLRKHPISYNISLFLRSMIDGKFQAANNINFKNAETLHTITESAGVYYNKIKLNNTVKYQYVRYLSKDSSSCNISELAFFSKNDSNQLKGKIIGTKGKQPIENVFDGNVLTYYTANAEPNKWVGLDLGKPTEISSIGFCSRNDKNHIIPGDSYELFYWENEWKSLGKKTGTDRILSYDNVPSNCLLLLRNFTEGKEERIFTYENGKQVWW